MANSAEQKNPKVISRRKEEAWDPGNSCTTLMAQWQMQVSPCFEAEQEGCVGEQRAGLCPTALGCRHPALPLCQSHLQPRISQQLQPGLPEPFQPYPKAQLPENLLHKCNLLPNLTCRTYCPRHSTGAGFLRLARRGKSPLWY